MLYFFFLSKRDIKPIRYRVCKRKKSAMACIKDETMVYAVKLEME